MGSETGGSGALQEPQRPVSDGCFAGTRLLAPQVGQGRILYCRTYHGRRHNSGTRFRSL
jgi:hypothetical protein